jgi:CubicO group peptidase (beta-lactamase class C family)
MQAKLQALLDRQIGRGNVFNVVAGVQSADGSLDVAAAAGLADPASGTAMTPETPYHLASIAKMYTASAILKLHEQDQLDVEETIATYLPASLTEGIHVYRGTDYGGQIRVYQLVNQTSGLADYFLDKPKGGRSVFDDLKQGHDRALDTAQVVEVVRGLTPKFPPGQGGGTRAHYADTNYRLLGAIVEAVTGQPVAEAFGQLIFEPLALAHTHFYDAGVARPEGEPATVYLKASPLHLPRFLTSHTTEGGIVSTVRDNLVFLRAFFEGRLFDAAWFDRLTGRWNRVFFPMQYGYGLMRLNLPRAFSPFKPFPEFVGHSGSTGSFAYTCPDKALYLVGTVNQIADPGRPIRLMMRIANLVG